MFADHIKADVVDRIKFAHIRVDVGVQGEVDDRQRAAARTDRIHRDLGPDDEVMHTAAGHDELDLSQDARQIVIADGVKVVRPRETLGPARGGVTADRRASATAQCLGADPRVRPRPDDQGASAGEVAVPLCSEIEAHAHQGSAGRTQAGHRRHLLGRPRGLLEQALECRAGGAVLAGEVEGPPYLPGDLRLADHHGFKARGDGEQMLRDGLADCDAHHVDDVIDRLVRRLGNQGGHMIDGVMEAHGVDVVLDPVAGREHDDPANDLAGHDPRHQLLGALGERVEILEGDLVMARTDEGHHHAREDTRGRWYRPDVPLPPQHPLNRPTADAALVRAARGERPDRLPVWFMRQAGRSLPEYRAVREGVGMLESCLTPELAAEITLQPVRRHGVDGAVFFSDIVVPLKAAGVDVDIAPGVGPVMGSPVRTADEARRLPTLTADQLEPVSQAVAIVAAELRSTPVIGFAGAPFTLAAYMIEGRPSRDYLLTKSMMYSDPAAWDAVLGWAADASATFLRTQVLAGASVVQLFDSWAGALSREDYVRYVAPYSQRVLESIADLGVPRIHFGVATGELLTAMRDIGADVMGVDHRLPLDVANERLGGRTPLQGNIDPAMLFTPWEVLAQHVDLVVERGRSAPAHILNLGHGVPPSTDPEVLTRIVAHAHGGE